MHLLPRIILMTAVACLASVAVADSSREGAATDLKAVVNQVKALQRTLEKQRVIGGGPRFRKFGRRVMYAVADLDAWAADRSFETTSDPEYAEHHSADSRAR